MLCLDGSSIYYLENTGSCGQNLVFVDQSQLRSLLFVESGIWSGIVNNLLPIILSFELNYFTEI